jgi:hypothetical protein
MPVKKPLLIALLLSANASTAISASASEVDDRIAALEQQLAQLKSLVAANNSAIGENLETLTVQAEEVEAVRPIQKGTRFQYGGYVELDAIASSYSEGRPPAVMDDLFIPSLIPVEPIAGESEAYRSTNVHAKTSRFFFGTESATPMGKVSSRIELDFILSGQGDERVSNSFGARIRHAYLTWDYAPQKSLLAGQAWSTFFNVSTLPDSLDFVGPVGTVFERQPMLRWTNGPWQLAVENQTTRVNLPGGSTLLSDGQLIPDVVARYNGKSGSLNWSMAAIGRQLSYQERPTASVEGANDAELGYGLSLAGKWHIGRDDLRFMASYGDALGRYMGLNAFNDGYVDGAGDINTIDQWGGFVAYRHSWTDQWRSSFTLSASGADNPGLQEFAAAGGLARAYRSMHLNLNYMPAPKLQLGGEFMYGLKELEDGRDGDMYRLQFAAKISF